MAQPHFQASEPSSESQKLLPSINGHWLFASGFSFSLFVGICSTVDSSVEVLLLRYLLRNGLFLAWMDIAVSTVHGLGAFPPDLGLCLARIFCCISVSLS